MNSIYEDIATRTQGDIYIGVVGPVRSGKSTFIKKFMDEIVLPNIEEEYVRRRANDELPQSAAGRTIMTTEPKFVPEDAVEITLEEKASLKVRLIDCVGYIIPSSIGYIENNEPRMVMTPWYEEPIPFNMAAEIGTQKVINEHSTIGLVVTTDGSISDIERDEYEEAEERVVNELKQINKPFVVILNSIHPNDNETILLAEKLSERYQTPVLPVSCSELDADEIKNIIQSVLFEFPVKQIGIDTPNWINSLDVSHWLRKQVCDNIIESAKNIEKIRDCEQFKEKLCLCDNIVNVTTQETDLGLGSVKMRVDLDSELFYKVLTEQTGLEIKDDRQLMNSIKELAQAKKEYDRIKNALDEVDATGYGIVMPTIEDLSLEEPEIIRQGGKYGVKLKASAPSIHMMKVDIATQVSPIVGSEKQSEDLVMSLMSQFDENPLKIWDSNIFGKSLHELVNEGLHSKLEHMPTEARHRLAQTLERLINEGCSGLICIIL